MKTALRAVMVSAVAAVALVVAPSRALAQAAPSGYIWDVDTVNPGTLPSYTQFNTSFVADNATEYVSFAFRETPAYFAFDDAVVKLDGSSTNLLTDPGFETSSDGQNCNHNNSLGCPDGWGAWIQPIDTSAIGQVATTSLPYGCDVSAHSGTNFWCDGSVQGYDAIYEGLSGLTVGSTYDIIFYLQDDSGRAMTNATSTNCTVLGASCIDALVYAGDDLPLGTVNIGPPITGSTIPEPSTLVTLGTGLLSLAGFARRRFARNS